MSEETKDCARLPVVAWLDEGPDQADATASRRVMMDWINCGYTFHPLCRLTDAQARLAEKDARIAQLAAHARGKNKALANALKEIERLKRTIETGLDNELALVGERTELRAQLEKLQSAPAERGVVMPLELQSEIQQCLYVMQEVGSLDADDISGDNVDLRFEDEEGRDTGCDVSIVEYAERTAKVLEAVLTGLNPAPATSDSDVREVK